MTSTARILAILLLLAAAPSARGQPNGPQPPTPQEARAEFQRETHFGRDFARAKFAASQADPRALEVAKLAAAKTVYDEYFSYSMCGGGSHYQLFPAAIRALQEELTLAVDAAAELLILERHWSRLRFLDDRAEASFWQGRADPRSHMAPRYYRLEVEQRLVEGRRRGKDLGLSSGTSTPWPGMTPADGKALARAKFDMSQADPHRLAQERFRAVSDGAHWSAFAEFMGGRLGLFPLSYWSALHRDAELALVSNEAEERAALEWHWTMTAITEGVMRLRFEAGRVTTTDIALARFERQEAELRLIEDRPVVQSSDVRAAIRPWRRFVLEDDDWHPQYWRELSRVRYAAHVADPRELSRSMLTAARAEYTDRLREFYIGRGYALQFASLRLLRAELALNNGPTDRAAAFDRHWDRTRVAEFINRARFDAGRASLAMEQESLFDRLEAELWRTHLPKK